MYFSLATSLGIPWGLEQNEAPFGLEAEQRIRPKKMDWGISLLGEFTRNGENIFPTPRIWKVGGKLSLYIHINKYIHVAPFVGVAYQDVRYWGFIGGHYSWEAHYGYFRPEVGIASSFVPMCGLKVQLFKYFNFFYCCTYPTTYGVDYHIYYNDANNYGFDSWWSQSMYNQLHRPDTGLNRCINQVGILMYIRVFTWKDKY